MAKKVTKKTIGKGIHALLSNMDEELEKDQEQVVKELSHSVAMIALQEIEVNPFQPRNEFDEKALEELADSIKIHGLIQPITVRRLNQNAYQLISGERRLRAAKMSKLEEVPAYIRVANDQEMLEMALVENIQRQDLDPIEIALSYQRLIDEINLTQEQMSERVGKKRSTIANYLRLLKLDPIIQTGMRDGFISMGHGRAIINIENQTEQLDIYEKIISNKLSVRATEALVRNYESNEQTTSVKKKTELPKYIKKGVKDFSEYFGHKIDIKVSRNGAGNISIPFHSEEDFNRIKKLVQRAK